MGSLRDLMADDLVDVILDEEDFAEPVLFFPADNATSFALTVAVGDITDQMIAIASGRADQQQISVTAKLSVVRDGIAVIESVARDPNHGDQIQFTTGTYVGYWTILSVAVDHGNGVVMQLRKELHHEAAAQNAAETR